MILIVLQKAFDTINNEILLKKLEAIGFPNNCMRWFWSYLSERIFFIEKENQLSDYVRCTSRFYLRIIIVPCVSVKDMTQAVKLNLFLYANDSCLMYQHRDVEKIEKQLNKDFEYISDWFVDNKLSIHIDEEKSKTILFASKRKIKTTKETKRKI